MCNRLRVAGGVYPGAKVARGLRASLKDDAQRHRAIRGIWMDPQRLETLLSLAHQTVANFHRAEQLPCTIALFGCQAWQVLFCVGWAGNAVDDTGRCERRPDSLIDFQTGVDIGDLGPGRLKLPGAARCSSASR